MPSAYKMRPVNLVGSKIRQLRKERLLTQTELSGRIGVQQSDLSRMEKGEYRVSLDTLFRLLSEFQMSASQFFDALARDTMTERDLDLVGSFQALDEPSRQQVERLLRIKAPSPTAASGSLEETRPHRPRFQPPAEGQSPGRGQW